MVPNNKYRKLPKHFWAHIKLLSEALGYSERNSGKLKIYNEREIVEGMKKLGLDEKHLQDKLVNGQQYLSTLVEYLNYRSEILQRYVEPSLMKREEAKEHFENLLSKFKPKCKLIMNKQKKEKKHYAYLTCIINILTEKTLGDCSFVQDPQNLVVITKDNKPIRTFTRRFDGAYPSIINPKALWEVKEYYGTTTFGSRVADGIYESMLDGEELLDLSETEGIDIKHYLIIDDYFTWWVKGRSYLCRIVDMLHMGYINEAIFGREVLKRWPEIVRSWKE